MDCNEINHPISLVNYFRKEDESAIAKVLNCFFELYLGSFKQFTYIFCLDKPYAKYNEEQLAWEAFNEGLLSFYFYIKENGFANGGATVKSLFITFCVNKLKGLTTNLRRQSAKQAAGDPNVIIEKKNSVEYDHIYLTEEMERSDREMDILKKAFQLLSERCTNLIRWRKIDKMKDEEIAARLNIQAASVNNEVFKCFKRLKLIVDDLQKKEEK